MMIGLSDNLLAKIALNVIAGFLALFGMTPSVDGITYADHGPHRVFTVQSKVPPALESSINPSEVYHALEDYLAKHNAATVAVRFHPYNVEGYVCSSGTFLYTSVYHSA